MRGTLLGIGQALLVAQAETMPDPNAVQAPAMLSLDEIVPLVRAVSEGEIIDAQVVDTGGSPVYEVKVLEPDGSVRVLMFDALTGSQLGGG